MLSLLKDLRNSNPLTLLYAEIYTGV